MTLEFRCEHVGVTDCKSAMTAETKDELLTKVAEHARTTHGVELNDTLINYALSTVTEK
jgi:predicted small metal-binding protein